jgi:hypothetical protein
MILAEYPQGIYAASKCRNEFENLAVERDKLPRETKMWFKQADEFGLKMWGNLLLFPVVRKATLICPLFDN